MQTKNIYYSETQNNTSYPDALDQGNIEVWEGDTEIAPESPRDSYQCEPTPCLETNEVREMIRDLLEFEEQHSASPVRLAEIKDLLADANYAVALKPEARQHALEKIVGRLSDLESQIVAEASGTVDASKPGTAGKSGTRKAQLSDQLMQLQEKICSLDLNYLEKQPLQKLLQACEEHLAKGEFDDAEMILMQLDSQFQMLEADKQASQLLQLGADEVAVKDFISEVEAVKFRVPEMKSNFLDQAEALLKDLRSGAKSLEQVESELEAMQANFEAIQASPMLTIQ